MQKDIKQISNSEKFTWVNNFVCVLFPNWEMQKKLFTQVNFSARMKFNKRFQLVLDNLDEFAVKLEKSGKEINKRSEMLKEYCSKIVNEI